MTAIFNLRNYFLLLVFVSSWVLAQTNDIDSQLYQDVEFRKIEDVLNEIKNKNLSNQSFQADFKELSPLGLKQGKIYFKLPNHFKLEYFRGSKIVTEIISSSNILFIHFIPQRIVYEQELEIESTSNQFPILIDFEKIEENYNFNFGKSSRLVPVFSETEKQLFNLPQKFNLNANHFFLTPKDITRQLDKMEVWFDGSGRLVRVWSKSVKEEVRDIYFFNFRDEQLSDLFFEFISPPNVRVVRNLIPDFQISIK